MKPSITIPAFAKINLSLRVLGKRDDGYHELDTIFQTISLHDTLEMSLFDEPGVVLSCSDRRLAAGEENLIIQAVKALQDRAPEKGASIRLDKRIPIQAGLGGGSSDAAVTLLGLSRLWELNLREVELIQIAAKLGADVPFFLQGGTGHGAGIGDRVERLPDSPDQFLVIIKPNANSKTTDAYKALDEHALTTQNSKTILLTSEAKDSFDAPNFASLQNDFEPVAFDLEPEIGRAKAALLKCGAGKAMLAGGGSAVFGVFDSKDAQRRAIQTIELETGWRVFPCKTVGRDEYQAAMRGVNEFLT